LYLKACGDSSTADKEEIIRGLGKLENFTQQPWNFRGCFVIIKISGDL
jgi:hypothetical protein